MTHVDEPLQWRSTAPADLDAIAAIANQVHVALRERNDVLAEKLRLYPAGCFSLIQAGAVVGYALSHPWPLNSIPALDTFLGAIPAASDGLFVHDVVVLPQARGRGAAAALIGRLADLARRQGLAALALVSVYDTQALWARCGFAVVDDARFAAKLASYGDTARTMRRVLR